MKNKIFNYITKFFGFGSDYSRYYKSFMLWPFLFKTVEDLNNNNPDPDLKIHVYMALLTFACLTSFVNLFLYVFFIQVISKYEIKKKFPFFQKMIGIYEKSTHFFIIFEGVVCFVILVFLLLCQLFMIYILINK